MKIFIFIVFMIWCIPGSYAAIRGIKFLEGDGEKTIFPTLLVFWYIAFTVIFIVSLIRWDILNLGT